MELDNGNQCSWVAYLQYYSNSLIFQNQIQRPFCNSNRKRRDRDPSSPWKKRVGENWGRALLATRSASRSLARPSSPINLPIKIWATRPNESLLVGEFRPPNFVPFSSKLTEEPDRVPFFRVRSEHFLQCASGVELIGLRGGIDVITDQFTPARIDPGIGYLGSSW